MSRSALATSRPGLSERAIALLTEQSVDRVTEILEEECRRGTVEPVDGGWRLTETAERLYGPALRAVGDGPIQIGRRVGVRRTRV